MLKKYQVVEMQDNTWSVSTVIDGVAVLLVVIDSEDMRNISFSTASEAQEVADELNLNEQQIRVSDKNDNL